MPTLRNYHTRCRPDVLDAVPPEALSILSVGCASGATERHLVSRGCLVAGIERHADAAAVARRHGLVVLEGDASVVDVSAFGTTFDFIVYADVLEHLPDPESVLDNHVRFLRPGGGVYISVPNFRHHSVLCQLAVHGKIGYTDAGILDRTHIRITTRKMVLGWLQSCGLKPVRVEHRFFGRRSRYLSYLTGGLFKEFLAHHIAVLASRPV